MWRVHRQSELKLQCNEQLEHRLLGLRHGWPERLDELLQPLQRQQFAADSFPLRQPFVTLVLHLQLPESRFVSGLLLQEFELVYRLRLG